MPKIKRWFAVSHDINHSATMRELAREFGLAGWRVWLEILSISDRVGEYVDCTSEGALSRLTSAAETRLKVTSSVVQWLLKRNCVATVDALNHVTRVVNYWDFHRTEERKPIPPNLPDLPDRTRPPPKPPKRGATAVIVDLKFETFYKSYPKKRNKPAAARAWRKEAALVADLPDKIMAALERHKKSRDWQKDGGRYVPHPASWLNGRCWEDELLDDDFGETVEQAQARLDRLNEIAYGKRKDH